jgi:D-serine deaminase-like pyridoxal phosphate-dependent protein
MSIFTNISKPTLILDEKKALSNIHMMSEKIKKNKVNFRPHFKTHQSAVIGDWFKTDDVSAITVSSVDMAIYFANNGWKDILIAFPVNIREIEEIVKLAKKIKLSLLIESLEVAEYVNSHLENSVDCWIKIDVGSNRTGIVVSNREEVIKLINFLNTKEFLIFKGLLSHAGHTYKSNSKVEIENVYWDALKKLTSLKGYIQENGIADVLLSVGDTPSASILTDFGDVNEMRPGNFIFYDMQQFQLGVCKLDNIAVCVACPVVALHPERNEAVIYGGAIHLSKDYYNFGENNISYGGVVLLNSAKWNDDTFVGYVKSLSQEHGIIKFMAGIPKCISVGSLIGVIPSHSCLSVQALRSYINLEGYSIPTMLS